jgi:acyl-CoA synthetase (NDP forming)
MREIEKRDPPVKLEGVLVQAMASRGIEMIAGIFQDALLGPTVLVGLGGIFAEVFDDVSVRVPPITQHEAETMIRELKCSPILFGARGKPRSDIGALADVLVRLGWLASDIGGELEALDLNPVVVYPDGRGVLVVGMLMQVKG